MAIELGVVRDPGLRGVPGNTDFQSWVNLALEDVAGSFAIALRVVGAKRSGALNRRYRGQDGPTNVLSFPADVPDEVVADLGYRPLGDLVLCAPVLAREAAAQNKPLLDHWAHMTIHGVLHLLGYAHELPADARRMESKERELLARIGIPDPYAPGRAASPADLAKS